MLRHRLLFVLTPALLVPLLVAFLLGACSMAADGPPATPSAPRTVILTAFGGAGFGETQPFWVAMQEMVTRTLDSAFCEGVYEGEISGQPVVLATTGTGSDNSGPCMQELLTMYGTGVNEVIWAGIGGVTPAVGGLVDSAGRRRPDAEPVMIGDVCISTVTWYYDLHFSSVSDWAAAAQAGERYDPAGGGWSMKPPTGTTEMFGFDNARE